MESWLPVVGYEGLYQVSNRGRVRSLHPRHARPKMMRTRLGEDGYRRLSLCRDGTKRTALLHCVVAEAFLGPRPDGLEVGHKDGVGANCAAANLAYVTSSENKHQTFRHGRKPIGSAHHGAILDEERVLRIKIALLENRPARVARDFRINISTLYSIIRGKTWRHVTLPGAATGSGRAA